MGLLRGGWGPRGLLPRVLLPRVLLLLHRRWPGLPARVRRRLGLRGVGGLRQQLRWQGPRGLPPWGLLPLLRGACLRGLRRAPWLLGGGPQPWRLPRDVPRY